jgi:predicted nucleotidyltransferase
MSSTKERLVKALAQMPEVELAVLFGSAARGEGQRRSDLDVAVRLKGGSAPGLPRLQVSLARATGREVDLVSLDASPPLLRFEIARDGVVLLERTPHAWADFRARAMIDWWDWAPIARRIHAALLARLRHRVGDGPP